MFVNPKITFMCVTYNRVKMLKNLLLSFTIANKGYDNFEWLIMEHDTTDGTVDFLKNLHNYPEFDCLKGKIKIFYETEKPYLELLESRGIDVSTNKKKAVSFFGKFRNDLVRHSQGDIIIDFPDDHQFIYKGNWCQDIVDIFNDRIKRVGRDDIGTLTFRTRHLYRILKKNNSVDPEILTEKGLKYYVVNTEKTCDEWGAISRENFEKMGGYDQLENESEDIIRKWNETHPFYWHYHLRMIEKTSNLGLKKMMTKVPITHDCLDNKYVDKVSRNKLAFPIFDNNKMFCEYSDKINRCVAIEEYENLFGSK